MTLTAGNLAAIRIRRADDVRRAAELFQSTISAALDLRIATCHDIASSHPMTDGGGCVLVTEVFGWHDPKDHYWQRPRWAMRSPLLAACRYESEPFWCNAHGFYTEVPNRFLSNIDLTNFEARAHVRAAIIVPVHLPFGQIGACTYSPCDPEKDDLAAEFDSYGSLLGLYARTFISTYVLAMRTRASHAVPQRLSRREMECLRWVAMGKTDDEISEILSLSRSTVRFHLINAASKLNAVNRAQTVLKAAVLGYI